METGDSNRHCFTLGMQDALVAFMLSACHLSHVLGESAMAILRYDGRFGPWLTFAAGFFLSTCRPQ